MSLRRQLLLVSLLLLSLPWAGCQFIREMEGSLRQGQAQSMQASARAIAAVLSQQDQLLYPHPARRQSALDEPTPLYAYPAQSPIMLDGYGDGWEEIPRRRLTHADDTAFAVEVQAQTRGDYLYLLLRVADEDVVFHNPGLSQVPNGDRLVLRLWRNNRRQDFVIATAAPGSVRARWDGKIQRGIDPARIRGYWQDIVGGYSLELELPLDYTGERFGFFVIDETSGAGRADRALGNITRLDATAPPWLIHQPRPLQEALTPFAAEGLHLQIVDRYGWELANMQAQAPQQASTRNTFWLLRLLYRSALTQAPLQPPPQGDTPGKLAGVEIDSALHSVAASARYRDPHSGGRTLLSSAAPIADTRGVAGAVIVQQSGDTYLSLTDQAFSRLLGYSLVALSIGALGLLTYATLLSLRIRRLARSVDSAIGDDGRVLDAYHPSSAPDEIGDLSRQYGALLQRLREYNDYLRTLSRKLSHELRTPVAVIQSSLDNLENSHADDGNQTYIDRAREGLRRLQHILSAMSEANRLEESIHNQEPTQINLAPLLQQVFQAYREIYTEHRLTLDLAADEAWVVAVPELLVQALDKLLDNAASFTPSGGAIALALQRRGDVWALSVSNTGPALSDNDRESIFEPMVSLRERGGDDVHLGLGLHIVRLIADFHRGTVRAENLAQAAGVIITLELNAATE